MGSDFLKELRARDLGNQMPVRGSGSTDALKAMRAQDLAKQTASQNRNSSDDALKNIRARDLANQTGRDTSQNQKYYDPTTLFEKMSQTSQETKRRENAYQELNNKLEDLYSSSVEQRRRYVLMSRSKNAQNNAGALKVLEGRYSETVSELESVRDSADEAYKSYLEKYEELGRLQSQYNGWKNTIRRGLSTNEVHNLNREKEGLEKINAQLTRDMAAVGSFGSAAFLSQMDKNRSRISEIDQQLSNTPQADEKKAQEKVEELTKLINGLGAVNRQLERDGASMATVGAANAIRNQIQANTARIRELERDLQQANAAVQTARDEAKWNDYFRYADRMEEADFDRLSKYKTTANGKEIKRSGADSFYETGFDNIVYDYINRNPEAVKLQSSRNLKEDLSYLEKMTNEEIGIYNYVYAKEGPKAASEYLEHIHTDLTGRRREDLEQDLAEQAKKNPFAASALSVMLSPVKGASFLGQSAQMLTEGRIDENAGYNAPAYIGTAIRGAVSEKIEDKWGKWGSGAYQLAMSMGDFVINGLLAKRATGTALEAGRNLALAIMGTGAAADTTIAAKDRGLSDKQAYWLGALAGLAEVATEKFSIDTLLDKSGMGKSAWGYIKKNMLAEGGEEIGSELFNFLADILISKDQSQWQQSIEGYVSDGMTREQAFAMAVGDQAANVFNAGAGGALSGGIMAGGNVILNHGKSPEAPDVRVPEGEQEAPAAAPETSKVEQEMESPPTVSPNMLQAEKEKRVNEMGARLRTAEEDLLLNRLNAAETDLQISGVLYGASNAQIESAQRMSDVLGKRILFEPADKGRNGWYKRGEDIIYLNPKSANPVAQVIGHELTHSIEVSTEDYGALQGMVMRRIGNTGGNWVQLRHEIIDRYSGKGVNLTEGEAEREVVAEYVEKHLLTDEQAIGEMVRDNRSLARRILDWLDGLLAKLGNKRSQERQFVLEAREKYRNALQKSYGIHERAQMQQARAQAYAEGDDEAGDALMDAQWEEPGYVNQMLEDDLDTVQFSFAGENARDADLNALQRARQMEEQNVDPETIRKSTGWFRGMEGKWRWEIDDSSMQYYRSGDALFSEMHPEYARQQELERKFLYGEITQEEDAELRQLREIWGSENQRLRDRVARGNAQLQNLIRHDALFESYPWLRGVKVRFADLPEGTRGQWNRESNTITLSNKIRSNPEGTLLHEIQHAIQDHEGFSGGASTEYWDGQMVTKPEYASEVLEAKESVKQAEDAFRREWGDTINLNLAKRYIELDNQLWGEETDPAKQQELADQMEQIEQAARESGWGDLFDDYYYAVGQLQMAKERAKLNRRTSIDLYRNTAGEIEARDSAGRKGLDPEGRKNTPPNLGDERTVFADGNTVSMEYRGTNENGIEVYETSEKTKNLSWKERKQEFLRLMRDQYRGRTAKFVRNGHTYYARFQYRDVSKNIFGDDKSDQKGKDAKINVGADGNIFELVENARYDHSETERGKNQRMHRGVNHWDYFVKTVQIDGAVYDLYANVRKKDDGSYVYNIEMHENKKIEASSPQDSPESGRSGVPNASILSINDRLGDVKQFSISEETGEEAPDPVEMLPGKVRSNVVRYENEMVRVAGTSLGVAHGEARGYLKTMAREISREYLQTGQVSQEAIERLAEEAWQQNPKKYDGPDAERFKRWEKDGFVEAAEKLVGELEGVKHYLDKQAEIQKKQLESPVSQEEVTALYPKLKEARRNYEKVMARTLLTDEDQKQVSRLLRGDIELQHLKPGVDNVTGIRKVYEAKLEYEKYAKQIRQWNRSRKARLMAEAAQYTESANAWKDKRMGIAYSRETMERNIRDIVPDKELAERIIDTYIKPVHDGAANANRTKNKYRDRIRALNLSQKAEGEHVSEAYAVQLLGEAEDNIRFLERSRGRIKHRDGKTIDEWQAAINDLWTENPQLDQAKIRGAVEEFRKIYDELFQQMNEARIRNGYEPVNYRQGYFPHFQAKDEEGIMAQFGKALGIKTEVTALPTSINGLTHTFKPGIRWMGNALERKGFETAYDALEGFDRYIEGVADVIHQTDSIQRLRALEAQARYRTTDEGIRQQIDSVRARDDLSEIDKENRIKEIYENARYALSNFVVELEEYTNLLANKKSRADRNMEQAMGRDMYNLVKSLESRVAANMVAINPGSWLTNFIPLTQGAATLDKGLIWQGMLDTLKAIKNDDGFVDSSSFLVNRRGSDPLVQTWQQKASAKMSKPMEIIDSFTADSLVRARFKQNVSRGMSDAAAIEEADQWAAGVMADRSKGSTPTLFNRSNPLTKLFTQFQLEVNNQLSYVFKDIPREAGERDKYLAALALMLFKFAIGAFFYNEAYEYVIGRRPALDPLGILNDTVGDITGFELPNMVEYITGEDRDLRTQKVKGHEAAANLATNVLEEVPFIGGLMGGGRLPISSALPDWENLSKAAFNDEWSPEKRLATAASEMANPLTYLALPFGGGQLKKLWQGAQAAIKGGSYTVDSEGNDILQYPVYADENMNALRAMVFGKTTVPTGVDWIESGFKNLSAKATAAYQGMMEEGVPNRDAYELVKAMSEAKKTGVRSADDIRRSLLRSSDISDAGKAVAYYMLLANDKERLLMDELEGSGADIGAIVNALMDIREGKTKNDQLSVLMKSGLDEESYEAVVGHIMGTELTTDKGNSTQYADYLDSVKAGLEPAEALQMQQDGIDLADFVKLTDAGMSPNLAASLVNEIHELKPEEGSDRVTDIQKWRAACNASTDPDEQMAALEMVMEKSAYKKLTIGYDHGVDPAAYVRLREILPQYDANGSGSYSHDEIEAAIEGMSASGLVMAGGDGTIFYLTAAQKAALWQLFSTSSSAKNNPYDTDTGWAVIEAKKAE